MALTTLSKIKQLLNIPFDSTDKDIWLDSLRTAAESTIKTYCKRDLEYGSYTEFYDGNNTRSLILRQRPVVSVTNVWEDHRGYSGQNPDVDFDSTNLLEQGIDWMLDLDKGGIVSHSGILIRLGTYWSEVPRTYWRNKLVQEKVPSYGSIKVQYTAGYQTIPMDLQYAVCYLVSYMRRTIGMGGTMLSEKIGDYSYELFMGNWRGDKPPEIATVKQLLARYREVSI